jgi:hypothetical protein
MRSSIENTASARRARRGTIQENGHDRPAWDEARKPVHETGGCRSPLEAETEQAERLSRIDGHGPQ